MRILLPILVLLPSLNDVAPDRVDIQGKVMLLAPADRNLQGILGSILVEAPQHQVGNFDKASVAITAKTRITKMVGQEQKPAQFEDLRVGHKVEVQFTGPIAESYPIMARACRVVILDPKVLPHGFK